MSMKNEKYKSMAAMKKHEKSEGKMERKMEYGTGKPAVKKPAVKKPAIKGLKQMNFDTMGLKKTNLDKKAKKK